MDGFAKITNRASVAIKGMQSGNVQAYVAWYIIGAILIAAVTWICIM